MHTGQGVAETGSAFSGVWEPRKGALSVTERQEKFCLEMVRCGNATEAYKAAGYKPKSRHAAEALGSRLLRNDEVNERIAKLRQQMGNPKIMDAEERRVRLSEIAKNRATKDENVIKAIDTLNKMDCLYVQKTQLSGSVQTVPDRLVIDYGDNAED